MGGRGRGGREGKKKGVLDGNPKKGLWGHCFRSGQEGKNEREMDFFYSAHFVIFL